MFDGNLTSVVKMLVNLPEHMDYDVNWDLAKTIIDERKGIPVEIGKVLLADNLSSVNENQAAAMINNLELKFETGIHTQ